MFHQNMKERRYLDAKCVANKIRLTEHISATHEGNKPFRCDICDYRCCQKSIMIRHVASVHEGKKPFKCDICEYICYQKGDLNTHVSCYIIHRLINLRFWLK